LYTLTVEPIGPKRMLDQTTVLLFGSAPLSRSLSPCEGEKLTNRRTPPRPRRGHQSPEHRDHERRQADPPSQGGRWSRARACWHSAAQQKSTPQQFPELLLRVSWGRKPTSSQMDMTRTMGKVRACWSCDQPPTSL